jgi:inosose dehydratase
VLKKWGARVRHVHLKDIRPEVILEVRKNHMSFSAAVKAGVFTVPGDGAIDFVPVFAELKAMGYEGWWVVEAEQDPALANPLAYAIKARRYIRDKAGI